MEYKTRAWQTIEVDLGPGEAREVDLVTPAIEGVAEMGLPITNQVRCLGINEQVAQQLSQLAGTQDHGGVIAVFTDDVQKFRCAAPKCPGHRESTQLCTDFVKGIPNGLLE